MKATSIYFAPYHSQPGQYLRGSRGRFRTVEEAIVAKEWPYDNGDDPSFYAYNHGGHLTWGVCRQHVRNAIQPGDIVVFFAFTHQKETDSVIYRLSGIVTVEERLDRRTVFRDGRFSPLDYLNILVRPDNGGWCYDEEDHPKRKSARHGDWLWRIAVHQESSDAFQERYASIYRSKRFAEVEAPFADNYVLFSSDPDLSYVARNPPVVATAFLRPEGEHEVWNNCQLKRLTVETAAGFHPDGRDFLRIKNPSHRNVHVELPFEMPDTEAASWRNELIATISRFDSVSEADAKDAVPR